MKPIVPVFTLFTVLAASGTAAQDLLILAGQPGSGAAAYGPAGFEYAAGQHPYEFHKRTYVGQKAGAEQLSARISADLSERLAARLDRDLQHRDGVPGAASETVVRTN